jgi:Domain of unknown function (DUF4159)/Aerotolerance regulator N-terminal
MLDLGWLGFANPWLLLALISLPALWWLLRVIPPAPKRIRFPAIRFLLGLEPEEETSARTPLWLLLLRLFLAALLIIALAGPLLNPEPDLTGTGPLVLVADDGWAAAPGWDQRTEALNRLATRAERENREVLLVGTARDPGGPMVRRMSGADAITVVPSWVPKAWPTDRPAALAALQNEGLENAEIIWLTDGIAGSGEEREEARRFAGGLSELGPLQVFAEPIEQRAPLLLPPDITDDALVVAARRPAAGPGLSLNVRALGPEAEVLARQSLTFGDGAVQAEARIELPLDLLNQIARIEVAPAGGVGGVVLLDERWRRRVVGLAGAPAAQEPQPLLSELYYVERALSPHAVLRRGPIEELLQGPLSALVLTDSARLSPEARTQLGSWVEDGGVVIRFAGPRLANAGADDLVPVQLRRGDRNLDGALTWARPLPLASFDDDGPLANLPIRQGDVVVHRQVLAQPGPELAERTWARLEDGTPLITGEQRGEGWLVLLHTTANTTWSSLPLSGVFVDLLRRMVALGAGAGGAAEGQLAPIEVLDANGHLSPADASAQPIAAGEFAGTAASPEHPPGLYGPIDAGEGAARQALNLASAVPDLQALGEADFPVATRDYAASAEIDLMPWLLLAAMLLALADMVISLALRGLVPRSARAAPAAAVLLLCLTLPVAAEVDESIVEATSETRLAYVVTGLPEVDAVSRAGLEGLSLVLNRRTAVEAGEPRAVDLSADDLSLFPLLYWPVPPDHPDLPAGARDQIDAYLRQGGMILFDTGDAEVLIPGQPGPGPGERRLRDLLVGLNLPPLEPVPEDHTLTRSFYLLQDFPGRFTGRPVWVDHPEPSVNDGVSSIVIGAHDWAGAWATSEFGVATFPVVPGGEGQREMARRFGVNLVMYALTGNYKTDQVHIPALLERLGQ